MPLSMVGDYNSVKQGMIKEKIQPQATPFDLLKKFERIRNNPFYRYKPPETGSSSSFNTSEKPVTNLSPNEFKNMYKHVEPENDPFSGVGRNDPCPCGSGRKFKKCCM